MEFHHPRQSPNKELAHLKLKVTWDIPEGSDDPIVLVVDDAGSPALDAAAVPHLTLPGPHPLGGINLWKSDMVNTQGVSTPPVTHNQTASVRTSQSSLWLCNTDQ